MVSSFSCDFAACIESHHYQTGKPRAAIAGAEEKGMSQSEKSLTSLCDLFCWAGQPVSTRK